MFISTPRLKNGCREMRRFVHEAVNIILQRFVLSIVEHWQSLDHCLQTITCLASVPRFCGIGWWFGFVCWTTNLNHNVPKIKSKWPIHTLSSIQRYNFRFLAHPSDGDTSSTSEDTPDTTWGWFWVLKVASKVWVLKQSKSAVLCCVSHMTILTEIVCVINVRNQSC